MNYTTILLGFLGINRNASPFLAGDGEYAEAQNLVTNKVGVGIKTGDYTIKHAQITDNYDILGGIDFVRVDGTHTHVVACDGASNADLYVSSGSAWTAQSQSLTAGSKVRMAYSPTLDTLFAVNYEDATRSYNGSAWSTATNVTSAPKSKYIIVFGRRVYLLNCDVSATAYPSRAYRSSLVDSGSITWDTTYDWVVFDDTITGVGKVGENMFVGCENSAYIFTLADEKYQVSTHGCISPDSITSYGKWVFWGDRDGMYAFDGSADTKISVPIQEYWDAIPEANITKIQAEVKGHHLYIYLGDITVDGQALANVLFDYDILQNDWNRMSLADEILDLHTYVTSAGNALFFGNDDGEIFQLFSGEAQNGAVFTSFVETNWFYGSGPRYKDDFYELWGYGEKLSGLSVSYKVDDGEYKPMGELKGSTDVAKLKARGYRIKFLLSETSKNNLYELTRLDVGFDPAFTKKEGEE